MILKKGDPVPYDVSLPIKPESGKVSFRAHSADWKDDFDDDKLNQEWIDNHRCPPHKY